MLSIVQGDLKCSLFWGQILGLDSERFLNPAYSVTQSCLTLCSAWTIARQASLSHLGSPMVRWYGSFDGALDQDDIYVHTY